ncbi:MAG TPA: cupin domain-containing protein [Caulobacteraceae bacterium]
MRVVRFAQAPAYSPPLHSDVDCRRLQGHEAGPTERFWIGLSLYHPGGAAQESATGEETIYTVLEGELTVLSGGREETLGRFDSVHLPKGTVRSVENRSGRPATLLVAIATPPATPRD